jgi:hypothetical protein
MVNTTRASGVNSNIIKSQGTSEEQLNMFFSLKRERLIYVGTIFDFPVLKVKSNLKKKSH